MTNRLKFLHCSDVHLGKFHSQMREEKTQLRNLMSVDTENRFRDIINLAISEDVDFIINSGDLFDRINVKNRDIIGALSVLQTLIPHNIPFITIAGNHDKPFTQGVSSPLNFITYLSNCHVVDEEETKRIETKNGSIEIVAISYLKASKADQLNLLLKSHDKKTTDYKILVSHQVVLGSLPGFEISQSNELILDPSRIPTSFDYIAMGHIHRMQTIDHPAKNEIKIHYPGSPLTIDFGEIRDKKGVSIVSLSPEGSEISFKQLRGREFKEIELFLDDTPSKELEDIITQTANEHADLELFLGIRLKGGLQITKRRFTITNHYRDLKLKFAGFTLYYAPDFTFFDQDGISLSVKENWLLNPVDELVEALNDRESLDPDERSILTKLGKEIIKEFQGKR